MPIIIAISGISGAGKTTITNLLSKRLSASALYWDEFDEISQAPSDYVKWHEESKDYNAWRYDALAACLEKIKGGHEVICPATKKALLPTPYIIFDAPLLYKHEATGKFIDIAFYIDTPLDIALARRLIRELQDNELTKPALIKELRYYLDCSRPLFIDVSVKDSANHLIDGSLPIEQQLDLIMEKLPNTKIGALAPY